MCDAEVHGPVVYALPGALVRKLAAESLMAELGYKLTCCV